MDVAKRSVRKTLKLTKERHLSGRLPGSECDPGSAVRVTGLEDTPSTTCHDCD